MRAGTLFRWLLRLLLSIAAVIAALLLAIQLSPRPGAWLIALLFDQGAASAARALEKHVPPNIESILDLPYDDTSPSLKIDIHRPAAGGAALPAIVWIHGGAWISGDKKDVANYLKILAGHGFTTVSVGYELAPGSVYPAQIKQVNAALTHVMQNADKYRIDRTRLILAGDSAGGQLASQLANLIAVPDYARAIGVTPGASREQLRGVALFCGAYDFNLINLSGTFGPFLKVVVWSLFGQKDISGHPPAQQASVLRHATAAFPPAFITAGNADPLLSQSTAMAERLNSLNVPVDTLFFKPDHAPGLGHEYQFNLDTADGKLALQRVVEFLQANTK